jgi:hypothetical protein
VQADVRPQPLPDQPGDADYLTGAAALIIPKNTMCATAFWQTTLGPGFSRLRSNDPLHPLVGGFRITNGIRTNFEMPIVQISRQNPHKSACKRRLDRNPYWINLGMLIILRERQYLSYPKTLCALLLSGKLPSGQDSLGCALTPWLSGLAAG